MSDHARNEWQSQDAAEAVRALKASGDGGEELRTPNAEKFLFPGLTAILHLQPDDPSAERYEGHIIGWRRTAFVVWHMRLDEKKSWRVLHDAESVVRFFNDGRACAYKTTILDWHVRGKSRIVYMNWPREVRYRVLRQVERISTELLCEAETAGGNTLWGTLLQISDGGGRVYLPVRNTSDEPQFLSFHLPNGASVNRLPCEVKHASRMDDGIVFGLATNPKALPAPERNAINAFITVSASTDGTHKEFRPTTIILDHEPHRHEELKAAARDRHAEIVIFHDVFSCFAWLHARGGAALYIHAELEGGLVVDQLIRTVKSSTQFASVAMFLFGGDAQNGKTLAEEHDLTYLENLDPNDALMQSMTPQ